jgi:hypothetical protein
MIVKKDKSKIEVGVFPLGYDHVKLFAVPESMSGSVDFLPENKGITEIFVGIGCPWTEAVSILLHEAYEKVLIDLNTRYKLRPSFSGESSDYSFFMSHNQLSEAHERVGEFLTKCLPDFSKTWKKSKKEYLARERKKKK